MFSLAEKWDSIAFMLYNIFAFFKFYLFDMFRYANILKKTRLLKDRHKGRRCFIVMNGPSVHNYDLEKITDEITFCVNNFFLSPLIKTVNPNYYCVWDSDFFLLEDSVRVFNKLSGPEFILNIKGASAVPDEQKERSYFVYGKHMPSLFGMRDNLGGLSSSFTNISAFAILAAIYMGFSEIYVLGLDFPPVAPVIEHCYETPPEHQKIWANAVSLGPKNMICGSHWYYCLAHMQSYYLRKFADKKGVKVYNLNPKSYIRAFEFSDYDSLFGNEADSSRPI